MSAAMVRWSAFTVLLIAALGTGFLAVRSTTQRGMTMRIYDNLRWSGEPSVEQVVEHLDYGPRLRRNPVAVPDRSSVRLDGWVMAPRGGTYDFLIESTDDAWLRVNNKTIVTHRRGKEFSKGSVRLTKGFHELRIQTRHRRGDSRLRVQWRLPSGYMNMEALQPIFVQPVEPVRGPALPLAMRLGPVLLLLLAGLVAFGPAVVRFARSFATDQARRRRVLLGATLFVATVGVRCWDLNGAGETSDEWAYAGAGRIYVSNMAHGYFQSLYWNTNEEHPPIGKYVYGVVSHLAGTDSYTPLRFASAVMAGFTVLLTFMFGTRFIGGWVGFFAGLILVFLPPFIAHGKVAALDAPSVLLFTLGVYLFARAITAEGHQNKWYLAAGLVACLAFATKFSNATLFIFMMVLHFAHEWRNIRRRGILELPISLYILPALPMIVLLIVWPWLWREPFGQLVTTLQHWDYPIQEWFLGHYRQPPWYYFPVTFVATTPAVLLVGFGAFFYTAWKRRSFTNLIVLLWFLTPFLWTISVLKQDGIRYIYNMYPPLALMIAIGADVFIRRVSWRPFAAIGTAVYLAVQCWTVHPYYLDYYSELVGGTGTVYDKSLFEVGWWGEGMDKAYEFVNEEAESGATWDVIGVVNHTSDMLRDDLVYDPESPQYLIKAYISPREVQRKGYTEVFKVEVASAPLVIVYQRDDLLETD